MVEETYWPYGAIAARGGKTAVASWWGNERDNARCLACGGRIETALIHVGSIRCLECREVNRPLDASLVEHQRASTLKTVAVAFGRRSRALLRRG